MHVLIFIFLLCLRKVSRQEYLKKREQKKLDELRYDETTLQFSVTFLPIKKKKKKKNSITFLDLSHLII